MKRIYTTPILFLFLGLTLSLLAAWSQILSPGNDEALPAASDAPPSIRPRNEPPSPPTLQIEMLPDGTARLSFLSEAAFLYSIETREALGTEQAWLPLPAFQHVPGTGSLMAFDDESAANPAVTRRLYRLRVTSSAPPEGVTLAYYAFTDSLAEPSQVHLPLQASPFSISSGNLLFGTAQSNTWTGSGVPYAQGNSGWTSDNPANARNFQITLSASDGAAFTITNISFLARVTGSGPSAISLLIADSEIYQFDMPANSTTGISVPVSGYASITQALIRLAGWTNGWRNTSGGGDFRVDDFNVQGLFSSAPSAEPPIVSTPSATGITATNALLGGGVDNTGGESVLERGFYWSTIPGFTPPGSATKVAETGSFGLGAFELLASELPPESTIHYVAFARNSAGTGYSTETSFSTPPLPVYDPPALTAPDADQITQTTALLGASITDDGDSTIIERGVYWSLDEDFVPPADGLKVSETGVFELGTFSLPVTDLPHNRTIYFQAFATSEHETGFSRQYHFTTLDVDHLAFYSFTGEQPGPESVKEHVAASNLVMSAGSFSYGSSQESEWEAGGAVVPYLNAEGTGYWATDNQANARHFALTVQAEEGWRLNITNIRFLARATSAGPSAIGLAINGDNIHAQDMPLNTVIPVSVPIYNYTNIPQTQIRIQGWTNNSRATSGSGALRVDNILVQGYVTVAPGVVEPTVTSPNASDIGERTATIGGLVADDGNAPIIERGIYWSTIDGFTPPAMGQAIFETGYFAPESFSLPVNGLPPGTPIYFRAYAENSAGKAFSGQSTFQTLPLSHTGLLSLYEFTGNSVTPDLAHPALFSTHLVQASGAPGFAENQPEVWTGSGVPYAQLSSGFSATNAQQGKYAIYALEARSGVTFDITNISFLARATEIGPSAISIAIDGTVIHTQNITNDQTISISTTVHDHTNLHLTRVQIIGWDNHSRETTGRGQLRFDDVLTEGLVHGAPHEPAQSGRKVRLATYNTEHGVGEVGTEKYEALKSILIRLDADIIAFQELYATEAQSNSWAALADATGYPHRALAGAGNLSGSQRCGIFSRFPILETQDILSPPEASEMARAAQRVVIDVPDARNPLAVWNLHQKAMGEELDQFRRAIETIRVVENIDAYRAANPGHDEFVILGDLNADLYAEMQIPEFSEERYLNEFLPQLPASYILGSDITFPVAYHLFPDDRYQHAGGGLHRAPFLHQDKRGLYSFDGDSYISRLDYLLVSTPLAAHFPLGETYCSQHEGLFEGLPKTGEPLSVTTTWTASDHLPSFVDLYMTPASAPDSFMDEQGLVVQSTRADFSEPLSAPGQPPRTFAALQAVADATQVHITGRSSKGFELQFHTATGLLYTLEARNGFGPETRWEIVPGLEHVPGNGGVMTYLDPQETDTHRIRLYRLRLTLGAWGMTRPEGANSP